VVNILRKKGETFTSVEVTAKAERSDHAPFGFTHIALTYEVGGDVSHKAVEDAVHLSEEVYCSIAAMLGKTAKINYKIRYKGE
jgi:putative redox protein